jgi:iron-sulfur cluster assembly accessory protein
MINLTPRAIAELERLKKQQNSSEPYVRVKVSEGGCLQFFYQLDFASSAHEQDIQINHDSGMVIITDPQSHQSIQNLTIDYLEDLMGGAFQFKNPDITNHCNCGISFALES